MKLTKEKLQQIIKEELENLVIEEMITPDYDRAERVHEEKYPEQADELIYGIIFINSVGTCKKKDCTVF